MQEKTVEGEEERQHPLPPPTHPRTHTKTKVGETRIYTYLCVCVCAVTRQGHRKSNDNVVLHVDGPYSFLSMSFT